MPVKTQTRFNRSRPQATTSQPDQLPLQKDVQQLIAHFKKGRVVEAEIIARKITLQSPRHSFGWKALGTILQRKGRLEDAIKAQLRAVALPPADAEVHNNLGNIYLDSDQLQQAESCYRSAIEIQPEYAEAFCNLGIALAKQGSVDEAEAAYRHAFELQPTFAVAHCNLGNLLQKRGQLADAEYHLRHALALSPDYPEAHCNLARVLQEQGHLIEAEAAYHRAIDLKPDFLEAHINLGVVLQMRGQLAAAEASHRHAIEIAPHAAEAWNNLALNLATQHRYAEAEAAYRRAIAILPNYAAAHNNLGNLFHAHGQYSEAEALYRRAIELDTAYPDALNNLGNALLYQGNAVESANCYRRAIALKPDYTDAFSNLLFCLTHDETCTAQQLYTEHIAYGAQLQQVLNPTIAAHTNTRGPNRTLRIGIVSDDFRYHPVMRFIEPLLIHLSRRTDLTLHAFFTHPTEDDITRRFHAYFTQWHAVAGLSNPELAAAVRAQNIDILVDLSGHTANNRLPAFAYKPAPIQVSWLGYPGTTGLPAIDYYIADPVHVPIHPFAATFSEKLVHLPITATFLPTENAPPINPMPALSGQPFTFGSFNRLLKLNPAVIALWSELLRAVPNSRLLLGGMAHDNRAATTTNHGRYNILVGWFAAQGISAHRLSFHQAGNVESDMALHHHVDLCLDTFPYNGSTTLQNSLWMGVPTLTIRGTTVTSRMGASIQAHLDLEAFIATDKVDFVQKGIQWSQNLEALAHLRATLRQSFLASPLSGHAQAAASLATAFRHMWSLYCSNKYPEAFTLDAADIAFADSDAAL